MDIKKLNLKALVVPGVFLVLIFIFIISRNSSFLTANISEVLGTQIIEDSSSAYDLSDSKNPATILLYNQFSDKDFDGILDQDDETENKFAVVKFSKNEEIIFNGVSLKFLSIQDDNEISKATFLIANESEVQLKIDSSLIASKFTLVGRDFYKSKDVEQAIVFLRTN